MIYLYMARRCMALDRKWKFFEKNLPRTTRTRSEPRERRDLLPV